MAVRGSLRSRIRISSSPRFEIFYALRVLDQGSEASSAWRRRTMKLIPENFRSIAERVAPHPMMWPLLADSLRDSKPDLGFPEILEAIRSSDDAAFQQAVLGGIFHDSEAVAALVAGDRSLADAVRAEAEAGRPLVSVIGLQPFRRASAVALSLGRVIADPAGYRADLAEALETFWRVVFRDTWRDLEPEVEQAQESLRSSLANTSTSEFAREAGMPVLLDDRHKVITSLRGRALYQYRTIREINVLPSAFNDARLWAAYADTSGSVQLYFPVLRTELLRDDVADIDAAAAFRALGDTTRYAIASVLAREPQTSVELSKAFGVSKATISHHVQLMRSAGLLHERSSDNGIELSLNRDAIGRISAAATEELFGNDHAPVIRRSRRERRTRQ